MFCRLADGCNGNCRLPIFDHPSLNERDYQSQEFTTSWVILSNPFISSSSNPPMARQSISKTPSTATSALLPFDLKIRGQTTSLLVSPSHAICPGYSSTSGTSIVLRWRKASAHTPRALPGVVLMNWQAGLPQKGPKSSLLVVVGVDPFANNSREMRGGGNKDDSR
jgi:hypothetical protein